MKSGPALLLLLLAFSVPVPGAEKDAQDGQVVLDETFENRARGERCGWKDYSTLRGDSFAGVTEASASPFDGGWRAYLFRRAADRDNGWALLELPETRGGAVRVRFDFMAPRDGGGNFQIHNDERAVWTALVFDPEKQSLAVPVGRNQTRKLLDLEPHVWYRVEISAVMPEARTFDLLVLKHRPEGGPERFEFKGLPAMNAARGISRFKIEAPSGRMFYLDNLRLEARP